MAIHEPCKYGLPSLILTPEQQRGILADMSWDGTEYTEEGASVPYRLMREWFANLITSALKAAVEHNER